MKVFTLFGFVVVASAVPYRRWGHERGSVGCPDRTNRWFNAIHTRRLALHYGPTCPPISGERRGGTP